MHMRTMGFRRSYAGSSAQETRGDLYHLQMNAGTLHPILVGADFGLFEGHTGQGAVSCSQSEHMQVSVGEKGVQRLWGGFSSSSRSALPTMITTDVEMAVRPTCKKCAHGRCHASAMVALIRASR